jgi:hypothetical protein
VKISADYGARRLAPTFTAPLVKLRSNIATKKCVFILVALYLF